MSYSILELSKYLGRPICFLRLARGSVLQLYTSADRPITIGTDTYLPMNIERGPLRDGAQDRENVLDVSMEISAPCTAWWRPYPSSTRVDLTWMSRHWGDSEMVIEWSGRVIGASFTDTKLKLACEPSRSNAKLRGRFLKWRKGCTFSLYDEDCRVDKAAHALPSVLPAVDGLALEATEFGTLPSGRLAGGFITWLRDDGETDFRTINAHSGDAILLNYGTDQLAIGSNVIVYPGCRLTEDDCVNYFNNGDNFGGAKNMPIRSPFDGNPV